MADQVSHAAAESKRAEVESIVRRLAEAVRDEVSLNARLCLETALSESSQLPLPMENKGGERK